MKMQSLSNDARWYVYELIDSRDGKVFYVGKGSGDRISQHERQAKNGVCSKKTFKINEIHQAGASVLKKKVAFFWDEQAAYDHETERIQGYGLENLTNVIPGGQKAWAEREMELAKRKEEKSLSRVISEIGGHIAWWLVNTRAGKDKVQMVFSKVPDRSQQTQARIFYWMCNDFMGNMINRLAQKAEHRELLAKEVRKYGVNLSYSVAAHGCA